MMYKDVYNVDDFVKEVNNKFGKFILLDNDENLIIKKICKSKIQNKRIYKVKNINTNEIKLYSKSDIKRFAFRKDAFVFKKGEIYGKFKILDYIVDDGIHKRCYKIQNINTNEILYYKREKILKFAFNNSIRESQLIEGKFYGKFKIIKYLGRSKYIVLDTSNNKRYELMRNQILNRMNDNSRNYLEFKENEVYGKFKIIKIFKDKRNKNKKYLVINTDNGKQSIMTAVSIKNYAFQKSINIETSNDIIMKNEVYGKFKILDKHTNLTDNNGNILFKVSDGINGDVYLSSYSIIKQAFKKYTFKNWYSKKLCDIYNSMVARCYNPNDNEYYNYGGKGIRICNEWYQNTNDDKIKTICRKNFNYWAIINGYYDNLTIDRYDSNGNYTPENCQWTDVFYNSLFKGSHVYIIHLNINGYHIYASESAWSKLIFNNQTYISRYFYDNPCFIDYERLKISVNMILNNLPQYIIEYVTRGIPKNMIMPVLHVEFDRRKPWYIEWTNTLKIY